MRQRIVAIVTRPEIWLLGLLVWILLSATRSLGTPWARAALTEALRWTAGISLALAFGSYLRRIKIATKCIVTLAGVIALLGVAGGFSREHSGLTGPYQDHQLYGSVLLLFLPMALALALTAHDLPWRLGAGAAGGAGLLCLGLSQTRSAWAGLVAAALVFGGLWLARSGPRRDWRVVCLPVTVLAAAMVVLWLVTAPADLRAPLEKRVTTLSSLRTDSSWQERLVVWKGAAHLVAAHPFLGIGLGRYPEMQWRWTRTGRPLAPRDRPSLSEEAHNFYLQTASETGLIGIGLYLIVLSTFVLQGLGRLRRTRRPHSRRNDAVIIASLSMVAGQAVDALASPSWQFSEVSLFFWPLFGIGLAAFQREEAETTRTVVPAPLKRAGQFVLSGCVAVALAANILPLGLLTPVEAYTTPANWTFRSVVISGPQTITAGQTAAYTLTATYIDSGGQLHDVDVTFDPAPPMTGASSFFGIGKYSVYSMSGVSFGLAGTANRNVLTTTMSSSGDKFNVSGTFYSNNVNKTAPAIIVTVTAP